MVVGCGIWLRLLGGLGCGCMIGDTHLILIIMVGFSCYTVGVWLTLLTDTKREYGRM